MSDIRSPFDRSNKRGTTVLVERRPPSSLLRPWLRFSGGSSSKNCFGRTGFSSRSILSYVLSKPFCRRNTQLAIVQGQHTTMFDTTHRLRRIPFYLSAFPRRSQQSQFSLLSFSCVTAATHTQNSIGNPIHIANRIRWVRFIWAD